MVASICADKKIRLTVLALHFRLTTSHQMDQMRAGFAGGKIKFMGIKGASKQHRHGAIGGQGFFP